MIACVRCLCSALCFCRETVGKTEVTVAVTPNGYADAPYQNKFVMPEERTMTFDTVLDILEKKKEAAGVFYVQKQNSNFTDEFRELIKDADSHIPWATEALGLYSEILILYSGHSLNLSVRYHPANMGLYLVCTTGI